jgi:hypothetical protein
MEILGMGQKELLEIVEIRSLGTERDKGMKRGRLRHG